MSNITELGTAQLTAVDAIIIELVEADETVPAIIIRWPSKPTVIHPHRFGSAADAATRAFAGAVVRLAHIRRDHRRL